ncbi:hypothetical protein [Novosphingobium album (ex Hu et al. 2023)]|uniref:Uncharacterized protein n=1 Tax=Novosphingobium album (ex Hu et al. 2023) TaxID=2930093 RepID=A0ABT0B3K0_9SPHN|nr:hypothetical protein [Novosphingobium album (ex Hu et al. 2023)]MCJ2179614.1 hypothetical protein [Novosphingobium album (ex Hu et al. 2023)]
MAIYGAGFLALFAALVLYVRILAEDAERNGEIRWRRAVVKRDEDPQGFRHQLLWLKAVPWIALVTISFAALVAGVLA